MRLTSITHLAYAITLVLTSVSASMFILSARSATQERLAIQNHLDLDTLAEQLVIYADNRTEEARLFVMRGDEQHLAKFYVYEDHELRLENTISQLSKLGITSEEADLFQRMKIHADALDKMERDAIGAYRSGKQSEAQQALLSEEHYQLHRQLIETVEQLRAGIADRSLVAVNEAKSQTDLYGLVAKIMLALTAMTFVAVLYFVLSRRVALPLVRLSSIVTRLARQDYSVDVPDEGRRDEIGEMNQAIQIFRRNGLERERLDAERRKDQLIKDLILQMMHRVQACQNQEELSDVVAKFMPQIFPSMPGRLLVATDGNLSLQTAGQWLEPKSSKAAFAADDCWAIRRGRLHISQEHGDDVACHHLHDLSGAGLCIPLTALGEIAGVIYLELPEDMTASVSERLYLELLAENIGLAVANLHLRQRLVSMAKHDALTGLLNRRSLDEAINRLISTPSAPLVCMMIDIDYFKRFNDRFGHDAGDAVMQYVARILSEVVVGQGDVFRFGGEEFTILVPGMAADVAPVVAERIRQGVERSPLTYRGQLLDPVTISIGVATSPEAGTVTTIIERADAALLNAKQAGRNRWILSDHLPGLAHGSS